jgi:hypothetical protein
MNWQIFECVTQKAPYGLVSLTDHERCVSQVHAPAYNGSCSPLQRALSEVSWCAQKCVYEHSFGNSVPVAGSLHCMSSCSAEAIANPMPDSWDPTAIACCACCCLCCAYEYAEPCCRFCAKRVRQHRGILSHAAYEAPPTGISMAAEVLQGPAENSHDAHARHR